MGIQINVKLFEFLVVGKEEVYYCEDESSVILDFQRENTEFDNLMNISFLNSNLDSALVATKNIEIS